MSKKLFIRTDIGSGKPIILLHGMFADGSQWDTISYFLSKHYRVIVVDLFGHGKSPRPKNAKYTDKEHVEYLYNTLNELNATKDVTIVGYSMGGAVALAFSSIHPTSVDQLYLISTPYYLTPDQMIPNRYAGSIFMTKLTTGLFKLTERASDKSKPTNKIIEFGNESEIFHKMIGANDNKLDADIIRLNLLNLVRKFDFVGHLKNVIAPVTFYTGRHDVFVVQNQLNALKQYKPYMDIERLDIIKIDHMLVQNLPKKISSLLLKNKQNLLNIPYDQGSGDVIVLLHGIESSSEYWKHLIKPLSENHRVITVDLLGFGKSPKPLNVAYSLSDQVEWLHRTLQNAGVKKFEFCAHSLGSIIALAYGARYTSQVTKMTLLAPVFVPKSNTSHPIIKNLGHVNKISDGSFLYAHASQLLGNNRISNFIPTIRSIKNSVHNQKTLALAKQAKKIPTHFIYGKHDGLIDGIFLKQVSRIFNNSTLNILDNSSHNFALYKPQEILKAIDGNIQYKNKIKRASFIPPSFAKQLVKLALPILALKSIFYTIIGFSLFTSYAPWVLTVGLGACIMYLGYSYIRGAFSLRNENLSYIGYIFLGILGILAGWLVPKHSDLALQISVFIISGIILLAGLIRLIVSVIWVKQVKIRSRLFFSGALFTLIGAAAIAGGIISIKLIVYTLALILILKGFQLACFAILSIFFAYLRGFTR